MKMFDRLERALKDRGQTQKGIALRFGWQHNKISKWKESKNGPFVKDILAVARELGVPPGWLIDDDLPDDPHATSLPQDEEDVLRAYRNARGVLSASEVIELIAEKRGRILGALEQQSLMPGVMRLEPRPIGQPKRKNHNGGNSG